MSFVEFLILLVIAGVCGALGQAIAGRKGGWLVSIVLGFIGSIVGLWLARLLELPAIFTLEIDDVDFPVVWSIIGSALFVAVITFLTKKTEKR
ncbi:MAG: hypothetical protein RL885_09420 [Planctomycetota bacterium]